MAEESYASGVQELIERLRQDGVNAGEEQGQEVIEAARQQAQEIVTAARQEAKSIREQARREAQQLREAGQEALQMAARDTLLDLKSTLTEQFVARLQEQTQQLLQDEQVLQRLILEVAGRSVPEQAQEQSWQLLLPQDVVGLDALRRHPEQVRQGALGQYVLQQTMELLREGVELRSGDQSNGIRLQLQADGIEVDLTAEAITGLLLEHLLPRFRALLEGTIQ